MRRSVLRSAGKWISIAILLSWLLSPTVDAGHHLSSPAAFEQTTSGVDTAAIRGVATRSSTGPNDVPAGIVGWTSGDAIGFQGNVVSGLFRAFGNATQPQSSVRGLEIYATGNALADSAFILGIAVGTTGNAQVQNSLISTIFTASDGSAMANGSRVQALEARSTGTAVGGNSEVLGTRAVTEGNAQGQNSVVSAIDGLAFSSAAGQGSTVFGVRSEATGNANGQGSSVFGVQTNATGHANGDGSQIQALRATAPGNAVGQESLVRGATVATTGNAIGSASAIQSLRIRATGNAEGPSTTVSGAIVTAEGIATGSNAEIRAVRASTTGASGPAVGVLATTASTGGRAVDARAEAASGATVAVRGQANSPQGTAIHGIAGADGALAGRFDGRVQINCSSPPCLVLRGKGVADLAENMVALDRVQPGDVVVLTTRASSWGVARATRPYDTRVAGIVSTQPRILLQAQGQRTVPIAMAGVIEAKASTANGAIHVGDLLTTSPIPGHLMRCTIPATCVGAVVAKALEPLRRGTSTILVLVWRQ